MASALSATKSENVSCLQVLLQGPTCPKDVNKALVYACREGLIDCVRCLLAAGVDPNVEDPSGNIPIHLAVSNGHDMVVQALCVHRADVNHCGVGSCTPLHIAAKWGKVDCMEILLKHVCKVDALDSSRNTPLVLAVKNKQYIPIALLLDAGCNVNIRDIEGRTALHYASHTAVSVQPLIEAGADVNIQDDQGCTPLIMASSEGLDRVIHALTQAPGCDPNIATYMSCKTPLHILAPKGHPHSLQDLIDCGADMSLLDAGGKTPMWHAVAHRRTSAVAVLLKCTSHIDSCQRQDDNEADACPVQLAFDQSLVDIIKLFITCGYDNAHMRECLSQAQAATVFHDAVHWLHYGQQVAPLQQTCRRWIRHFLGPNLLKQCRHLPLPAKLIDFLLITELNEYIS